MQNNSETCLLLQSFHVHVETQFCKKIKIICFDEFEFDMKKFYQNKGFIHETSYTNISQQNEVAERKHDWLLNVAKVLHFQANLPIHFLGECALIVTYLIKRTPIPFLSGKTPYELLSGSIPSYTHLRVFGCLCYTTNTSTSKT